MTRQFKFITATTLTLCVILGMFGTSDAFWKKRAKKKQKPQIQTQHVSKNTFVASGKFTGAIDGFIEVGNKKVFIGDRSSIYVSGKGLAQPGHAVNGASLYIGGLVTRARQIQRWACGTRDTNKSAGYAFHIARLGQGC
jgi:hypothetical protein